MKNNNLEKLLFSRLLYVYYPISLTLSNTSSWSHYLELINIEDELERSFYEKTCVYKKYSLRRVRRHFVSRYQLYLPNKAELEQKLKQIL